MKHHVIIDGNNLLHAMFNNAHIRAITRTALVESLKSWAGKCKDDITLVFDGPPPKDGFDKPIRQGKIDIRFSAPHSADDVIVRMILAAPHPERLRVVSSDNAIAYEARRRRSSSLSCEAFLREVYPESRSAARSGPDDACSPHDQKAEGQLTDEESDYWLQQFDIDDSVDDDPFGGRLE
ncbi:MAG: NYN domain-containing protein [Planctomycetota bacterium]|jgi:predicted RNA-binding protein with PIN domain